MLIGYNPLTTRARHLVNFFRIVVPGADLTHRDMDFVMDEIERLGEMSDDDDDSSHRK